MRVKELSTKKKREGVAAQLAEIARSLNATCQHEEAIFDPRRIYLRLRLGDYWVAISLDGNSHCGGFLGHWNTEARARYPTDFGFTVHGSVNEFHYGKATTCCDTLPEFYAAIEAGLVRCAEVREDSEQST
jgi:hypothetical protein